ncbi:MAG: formate dehydrogenase beta subunit [Chloroflexota bacterium]|nr:formate dehydrogenase beta subunit [Chloroflexota bacterium]
MAANRSIVQELHQIQERCGYLPRAELEALAKRNRKIPLHRLHEVASFFPHFLLQPPKAVEVKVCRDMSCHLRGAADLKANVESLAEELGAGEIEVGGVSCLGQCDGAPALLIGEHVHRRATIDKVRMLLRMALRDPENLARESLSLATLSPTGWKIDPYGGREDYEAVRRFAANPDADGLIEALKAADLRGMGGAGVWAHQKWKDVRQARGDTKYCVVNADESEPGTFKDRELLLRTPQLVIEGLVLAGLLTGAERGYIYIRHEYADPIEAVRAAITRAEAMGICGEDVLGTGRPLPVEVFVSPGGYICGEQSALIEAMEDHRAEPRNKPPQLETNGLYNKPTLVSNVETYAWVPSIVMNGGAWYRDQGVNGAHGMRLFSISGDVNRPGVYEVPCGLTLRSLIEDHAGGLGDGQELKAFAPSGPSAGFLPARLPRERLPEGFAARLAGRERARQAEGEPPAGAEDFDVLDLELDLQTMRDLGLMLGAGLVVYGDRANMLDQALNASAFFRNESCGKCVPCRLGSQKLVEMAGGILQWQYDEESIRPVEKLLTELQRTMEMTSICGLGMVAGNPLISVFRHFRGDLEAYLRSPRLRTISDFAALRGPIGTMGTMSDLSGLLAPKDKIPTHQDTMSDFEILGDPDHD